MAGVLSNLLSIVLPKRRANEKGASYTSTFNPAQADQVLAIPQYREHLSDIFDSRQAQDSRALMKQLFVHDPDISAAVNAFLTVADTDMWFLVKDTEGKLDKEGGKMVTSLLTGLTSRFDYAKPGGFQYKPDLRTICANLRYMLLLRGGIGAELVVNKQFVPTEIRNVDLATVEWKEPQAGKLVPEQVVQSQRISLDVPTFFTAFFRRDPTTIYSYSPFVSSINTIAARQQVINDLYRIMRVTGYPRMEAVVMEEVLRKNAPAAERADEAKMKVWLRARLGEISASLSNLRADQAFVHFDSVETKVMNSDNPAAALDIMPVINTLNAQNQAALKTMSTIIGRGESGVNTASVESRIFSMNADQLNQPVAEILAHMLTLALRLHGNEGIVEVGFDKAELRPDLELEPQRVMKQSRLLELLSHGLITDDEFHLEMFGRPPSDGVPPLAGTGFMTPVKVGVDEKKVSPNSDPNGRGLAAPGSKSAKSNTVK